MKCSAIVELNRADYIRNGQSAQCVTDRQDKQLWRNSPGSTSPKNRYMVIGEPVRFVGDRPLAIGTGLRKSRHTNAQQHRCREQNSPHRLSPVALEVQLALIPKE